MSKIVAITYSRTVNLGTFNSERLEATVELDEGDNPSETADKLKAWVLGKLEAVEHDASSNGAGEVEKLTAQQDEQHYCQEHGKSYRRQEREGQEWYSHKTPDGWCREQR